MTQETSTVSTATWHPRPLPSRTTDVSPTATTLLSSVQHNLLPRDTPCCPPNQVVIQLSTTLYIQDYSLYYPSTPIHSFQPTFFPLNDASLVTPAFLSDLRDANISLLVTGMLTMLFVRNIFIAVDYFRRCKVKNKILFQLLIISQLLAPLGLIPTILSYFDSTVSCTAVIMLSCIAANTSLAILISGILGIKAYKCLNNSRIVVILLVLFQLGSSAVVAMDVIATRGARRLSGSCIRTTDLNLTRIYVTIQFAESLFICLCFLYACYKSRGSAAVRGRMSIHLSMEDLPNLQAYPTTESNTERRGWWDHVASGATEKFGSQPQFNGKAGGISALFTRVVDALPMGSQPAKLKKMARRRMSHLSEESFVALPRASAVRISTGPPEEIQSPIIRSSPVPPLPVGGRSSPVPSTFSRFSKLIPRMALFRAAMRDELLYTTVMTGTCVVVAVLAIVGLNVNNGLTVSGWIASNWGIISILTIHSFSRVVHRHERDALLQHPATCDALTRAGVIEPYSRRRPPSNPSSLRFRSHPSYRPRSMDELSNPFADTWKTDEGQSSATATQPDVQPPSPVVSFKTLMRPRPARNLTSAPIDSDFPTSGRGTPLVPHDCSDGTVFPESWLFEDDMSEVSIRTKSTTRRDGRRRTSVK